MHAPGVAVRIGSLKYEWVDNGQEDLHDLASDPGEERNLASAGEWDLAPFRMLRDEWQARRNRQPSYEVGETAEQEIADQLRALGYIE